MEPRAKRLIEAPWEAVLALTTAAVITVLSVFNVVGGHAVNAVNLMALAVFMFELLRDRAAREKDRGNDRDAREHLEGTISTLDAGLTELNQRIIFGDDSQTLASHTITQELFTTMDSTKVWYFKGGTGAFLRSETLPRVSTNSTKGLRDVRIEIIDPTRIEACTKYATYRHRRADPRPGHDGDGWTVDRVRLEGYATIIAAAWYSQHKYLDVHLALAPKMATFRFDMSSDYLIITSEDPGSSAQKIPAITQLYAQHKDELQCSFEQARIVNLHAAPTLPSNELPPSTVLQTLEALGLVPDEVRNWLTPEVLDRIGKKAISEAHAEQLGFAAGQARSPYPFDEEQDPPPQTVDL